MPQIDNFSAHSRQYARYRPTYPFALFESVAAMLPQRRRAWDCGTGNGQAAVSLAQLFETVDATDISNNQLANAAQQPNIRYSVQPAERTNFTDGCFDLIVVAQAIHWFDFDAFYKEVRRTAMPGALLLVLGYGLIKVDPAIDALINHLYHELTGPYWDKQLRYVEEGYQTIPFPFTEAPFPNMENSYNWSLEQMQHYLRTWSGVQKYSKANGIDPLEQLEPAFRAAWGEAPERQVHFPLIGRLGWIA